MLKFLFTKYSLELKDRKESDKKKGTVIDPTLPDRRSHILYFITTVRYSTKGILGYSS